MRICGTEDEYTMHICRCREPGWDSMFKISVKELHLSWLTETLCEHSVAATVKAYLLGREATLKWQIVCTEPMTT
jgi:hypothetical protein